jgi:secreted trypsin-like serine protease
MPSYMTSSSRIDPAEIVGGQDAPSPVPWQVSVRSWSSHFCGATILDESTLLCAAHCFPGSSSTSGKTIRAGSTQRSNGGQVFLAFMLLIYLILRLQLFNLK